MSTNATIHVHHVTRVEGHGNILVDVKEGRVLKCEWQVPESPRFFEAMVRGRHYSEVSRIVSRICGICSIGHTLASVKATEAALGIEITPQTRRLRSLLKHAENFDSHIVHALFLATPDLLGVPSVFPLVESHGEVVKAALRLKRFGHEWGSLIGGRTTHPTRVVVGGFSEFPTVAALQHLRSRFMSEIFPDIVLVLDVFSSLAKRLPVFTRPTEYMALSHASEYGLYDGVVHTLMPGGTRHRYGLEQYKECTNEYVHPRSTAKYAKNHLDSYLAGALARFNINFEQLHPEAKKIAHRLGLQAPCHNPYLNTAAQVVEVVHSFHEGMRLLDEVIAERIHEEAPVVPTRHGEGTSAVEVPRGILYHHYKYNSQLICEGGDCIIPTNQNHANIQLDFEKLVPELIQAGKSESEMRLALEMLVRAYDPCISCSTHYLDVNFV